jgi:hypothetical protein
MWMVKYLFTSANIKRVLMTSKGVVIAAAMPPAIAPYPAASTDIGSRPKPSLDRNYQKAWLEHDIILLTVYYLAHF